MYFGYIPVFIKIRLLQGDLIKLKIYLPDSFIKCTYDLITFKLISYNSKLCNGLNYNKYYNKIFVI